MTEPAPADSAADDSLTDRVRAALSEEGALAGNIDGFRPRADQIAMATAVAESMQGHHDLLVEAGTGTGKTFAYLTPALLSRKRVLIATGTKHLQDQLFWRDLDRVAEALGRRRPVALLKGRGNYLCRYRFKREQQAGDISVATVDRLRSIADWSSRTRTGDLTELAELGEDDPLWPYLISSTENCLGSDCPDYHDCFVVNARQEALRADIVVVNHHLLCADLALKGEGFGDLLPAVDCIVVDEAHRFADIAAGFFGQQLSARQINGLVQDVITEQLTEATDLPQLTDFADAVAQAVRVARLEMGTTERRIRLDNDEPAALKGMQGLHDALRTLFDALEAAAGRSKGLDNCRARAAEQLQRLDQLLSASDVHVRWLETSKTGFQLGSIPIELGEAFNAARELLPANWVFTSATLAVDGRCDYFLNRLGLDAETAQLQLQGPFDYQNQAMLILPENLPDPRDARFDSEFLRLTRYVIEATGGGMFVLFTSHRALRLAAEGLAELGERLLVQGEMPRHELLDRFRAHGDAVLLGAASFWEGVDVSGKALRCVLIDRLPFASPDDPMIAARGLAAERAGGNAFAQVLLPQAVLNLKQGVGRLIRSESDRGSVIIADPRLRTKPYGKVILRSLPPFQQVVGLAGVLGRLRVDS